jgi:large subunit ribosomal protein L19
MSEVKRLSLAEALQKVSQAQLKAEVPSFSVGDTVIVALKENIDQAKTVVATKSKDPAKQRVREQLFEGVVLAKRGSGINASFIVRKISHGEGVNRTFQIHNDIIKSVTVKRRGQVRKAKLYYLKDLSGKKARIREKLVD